MEARAYLRNARISPRKVQIVLDLIRNKPIDKALATLELTPKAASPIVAKLVKICSSKMQRTTSAWIEKSLCIRVLCNTRTDHEENHAESTGQSIQNFEENITHHGCSFGS